jgi:hypothetical protein
MRWTGVCGCFSALAGHVGGVSLNRTEQRVFDYILGHPEERQYWQNKVQSIAAGLPDPHAAALRIEAELWRYYTERSGVVPALRDHARHEGPGRTSMKNLAEHLHRLWVAPKPKPAVPPGPR